MLRFMVRTYYMISRPRRTRVPLGQDNVPHGSVALRGKVWRWWFVALALIAAGAFDAQAQTLRFSNHRVPAEPQDALVRIGPWYSTIAFSQSAGYRYTRSEGTGTDYLFGGRKGVIVEDGAEFPLVSTLTMRNYLLVSRYSDMDMSVTISYEHYPLGTQEDALNVNLADEGILGNFSTEIEITPVLKGLLYDAAVYKTDYVDTRGISDRYGGSRYRHFSNTAGMNLDWLTVKDQNVAISLLRSDEVPFDDTFEEQRSHSYGETLAYERKVTDYLVTGVGANFAQNFYSATNRPGSSTVAFMANAACKLTDFSMGSASVGYSVGSVEASGEGIGEDSATAVGSVSLTTQLSKSLNHSLQASRVQRGGFESSLETADTMGYSLSWKGLALQAGLFSTLTRVEPVGPGVSGYSDWSSGFNASYPIVRYVALQLSSTYTVRDNGTLAAVEGAEESASTQAGFESTNDYATWVSRAATAFGIWRSRDIDAEATFSTYVEHAARISDTPELEYTRDIVGADIVLIKKF